METHLFQPLGGAKNEEIAENFDCGHRARGDGRCAANAVRPEDAAAERAANQQKLKHNAIVNDNDCVTADAAARANALLLWGLRQRWRVRLSRSSGSGYFMERVCPSV